MERSLEKHFRTTLDRRAFIPGRQPLLLAVGLSSYIERDSIATFLAYLQDARLAKAVSQTKTLERFVNRASKKSRICRLYVRICHYLHNHRSCQTSNFHIRRSPFFFFLHLKMNMN